METTKGKNDYDAGVKLLQGTENTTDAIEKKSNYCIFILFISGIFNIILGILSVHYNYLQLILEERIRMRPGLPPLEYWRNPPVDIKLALYIFAAKNSAEFLNGTDTKIKLEEVGPIRFREIIQQTDIVFHENSTISYTTLKRIEFLPNENEPGILNKSVIIPNPILLGIVGYLHDVNFIPKAIFNTMSREDDVFINVTLYNLFWDFTTPIFEKAKSIVPLFLPRDNCGILHNAYYPRPQRFNARIGTKNGFENFFKLNSFNGKTKIPGFESENPETCPIGLLNARDGANYPPYLKKNTVLYNWRDELCRTIPFHFEKEVEKSNFKAYKFIIRPDVYDRFKNKSNDCLKGIFKEPLPDGLADMSRCAFGIPAAVSHPHFYGRTGIWNDHVEGIKPNKSKHASYSIIEPTTGVPLEQVARIQNNIVLPKLKGFNKNVSKFSNMIIPGFWGEYSVQELTPQMLLFVNLMVNVVPTMQPIMIVIFFTLGTSLLIIGTLRMEKNKRNFKIASSPRKEFKIFSKSILRQSIPKSSVNS